MAKRKTPVEKFVLTILNLHAKELDRMARLRRRDAIKHPSMMIELMSEARGLQDAAKLTRSIAEDIFNEDFNEHDL